MVGSNSNFTSIDHSSKTLSGPYSGYRHCANNESRSRLAPLPVVIFPCPWYRAECLKCLNSGFIFKDSQAVSNYRCRRITLFENNIGVICRSRCQRLLRRSQHSNNSVVVLLASENNSSGRRSFNVEAKYEVKYKNAFASNNNVNKQPSCITSYTRYLFLYRRTSCTWLMN